MGYVKNISEFEFETEIAWCPGCGNFPIRKAVIRALQDLGLKPWQVLIVSGIGQAAKFPHYLNVNSFHGLHGRAIPVATGAKIANKELVVLVHSGDGCFYAEGGNHLLHGIRRNPDITVIVHNNQIYGLTKGQASPTSERGMYTKFQPFGVIQEQFNPLAFAISQDCSFVARAFAGDPDHLTEIIKAGIKHKGFALIDVLQPCVSFNRINTYQWYRERVYKLEGHNPENRLAAFEKSLEWGDKIPLGILYQHRKPTYEEQIPILQGEALFRRPVDNIAQFEPILAEFR